LRLWLNTAREKEFGAASQLFGEPAAALLAARHGALK
jgi:hypothetical protein